jgi:transposase
MWLGIDISQHTLEVALLLDEWAFEQVRCTTLPNHPEGFAQLEHWVAVHLDDPDAIWQVCLEATGSYWYHLAHWLEAQGHLILLPQASRLQGTRKQQGIQHKTDREDAKLLALHGRLVEDPCWWTAPADYQQEFQELIRHLDRLRRHKLKVQNQLKAPSLRGRARRYLLEQEEFLTKQIEDLLEEIKQMRKDYEELAQPLELLETIPGIGVKSAHMLVSELVDMERFASAKHLASWAGLIPKQHESGTSVQKSKRNRRGNRRLKRILFMASLSARRANGPIRELNERLKAKGRRSNYRAKACMHKLLRQVYGVWKSGKPFDPEYGQPGRCSSE